MTIIQNKKCPKCNVSKDTNDFHKNRSTKDGFARICRDCKNSMARDRREKFPLSKRESDLKRRYGMSLTEYDNLYEKQGGVCAICSNKETAIHSNTGRKKMMSVDHCHKTGEIRGLLCSKCNRGIGYFNDNIDLLNKAIDYLKD